MHLDRPPALTGWLPLAACADQPLGHVGRKARTLARAGEMGLATPGGHVLPAGAFWAALAAAGFADRARYLAGAALALDPAHALAIARDIATGLSGPELDAAAAAHAEALYGNLGAGPIVCRSSAAMEDDAGAAFPGLFTSVLDIASVGALAEAIAACWRSVFDATLLRYLLLVRPGVVDFSLALLVQPQVAARWYGIGFGADPLGDAPAMTVQLTDEAPDALVGGAKPRRSFVWHEGAWRGDDVPAGLDALAGAMALLAREAGGPVDVEFALAGGGGAPVILQARPVTVVAQRRTHREPDAVRARLHGQGFAPGTATGRGGDEILLVEAVSTRDYARIIDARALVAAAETSPLGHVAILCRELGIPLVAGVGRGASALHGAPLWIDGDAGLVAVLSDMPAAVAVEEWGDDEPDAVIGIDELAIRLLVAERTLDDGAAVRAILAERRRVLGAAQVRIVGSTPSAALTARLTEHERTAPS